MLARRLRFNDISTLGRRLVFVEGGGGVVLTWLCLFSHPWKHTLEENKGKDEHKYLLNNKIDKWINERTTERRSK